MCQPAGDWLQAGVDGRLGNEIDRLTITRAVLQCLEIVDNACRRSPYAFAATALRHLSFSLFTDLSGKLELASRAQAPVHLVLELPGLNDSQFLHPELHRGTVHP